MTGFFSSLSSRATAAPRHRARWRGATSTGILLAACLLPAAPARGELVLVGEPIDASGEGIGSEVKPRVCATPAGGFLVAWKNSLIGGDAVFARRFDAAGTPLGEPFSLALNNSATRAKAVGCLPNGGLFVVQVDETETFDETLVRGRLFSPSGAPMTETFPVSQETGGNGSPDVACGSQGCVVVWSREGYFSREAFLRARTFDLAGNPTSAEIAVNAEPDTSVPLPAVAIDPRGGFTVAWSRQWEGEVLALRFGAAGQPLGEVLAIRGLDPPPYQIFRPDLAQDSAGRLFVVWTENEYGSAPGPAYGTVMDAADRIVRSRFVLDPSRPQQVRPQVFVDAGGSFVGIWGDYREPDSLVGRAFGPLGVPQGPSLVLGPDARFSQHEDSFGVAPRADGTFVLVWPRRSQSTGWTRTTVSFVRSASPQPPVGPWLGSLSVAGYSFKARISTGSSSIAGAQVPACIPETLCVSGAVPGRSEVFLRVIGPRPNGRMWPTLVKFSTSTVEVWVRQDSSGEVRYYLLEGARPGFDELPGLFDRVGFAPTAAPASYFSPLPGLTAAEPITLAGGTAPASDGAVFTSEHFPDFRFRARITAGGQVQEVRKEAACIEETLCLSGALPGRSEVFLRIIGPRPNGRLWPMIVKLTTSTLEVWIEQISTGETKHYRIEGAAPGKDDLTGIFDRLGFAP